MAEKSVTFFLNNDLVEVKEHFLDWSLARYLRDGLHLTGTKQACDSEGACGDCTVIVNGKAKRSCMTKVSGLEQAKVETIESLRVEAGQIPHPLLQTVVQDGIFQCGYCAPGALMSAKALLDEKQDPSDKDIEKALSTVICRCAGLNRMDLAVKRAAAILRGDVKSTWTVEDTAQDERLLARLTGKMKYTADLYFPNMAYAQAVRAGIPHAKVRGIDTSKAEKMPGVLRVFTAKDIAGKNIFGSITQDEPVLCDENNKVRYVGDALAVVVAETAEQAAAAAAAVACDLEPLPVVSSVDAALQPDAPVLHDYLRRQSSEAPNVLKHYTAQKGDIAAGFAQSDVIVEGDYEVPFIEHGYMELESSIAVPEADGTLTIYCGTQAPVEDQEQVAHALGEKLENIRVAHMYIGGGFGGKEDITSQIHVAMAARALNRPVKAQWSRAESLAVSTKRHAVKMHYKMGATRDGKLMAAEANILGDTGPYASVGQAVLFRTCVFACGPYVVPHARSDSYAILTNNAIGGAFRGYGSPQVAFGSELTMQKLADQLGMDAFDFRLKNALGLGDATITGDVITQEVGTGMRACIQAVKDALEKAKRPELEPDEKLGIGVAAAYKNVGFGSNLPDAAGAIVSLEPDGYFLVRHGATDMGQGVNDVMALIVARIMGIKAETVRVHTGDTRDDPPGGMTTASRQTFITGNATLQASQQLHEMLWKAVAEEFSAPVDDLEIKEDAFVSKSSGRRYISLEDLAKGSPRFICDVTYNAPPTQPPPLKAESYPTSSGLPLHFAYDYGAQAAMVAVNEKTGAVRILKIFAAHDVGIALHRRNIIGQIEGAVVQGIGYALSEEYKLENGIPKSTRFKDMGLLRFRDIPEIVPIVVEEAHPKGPFGAKGMGELTISPTAPAIVNAIHDAVGIWINTLPVTKEKVVAALSAKG